MNRQDCELLSYKEEGKEKGMGAGTIESQGLSSVYVVPAHLLG